MAISLLMMVALLTRDPQGGGLGGGWHRQSGLDGNTLTGYLAGLFGLGLLIYLLLRVAGHVVGASYRLAYVLRNRLFTHFTRRARISTSATAAKRSDGPCHQRHPGGGDDGWRRGC